MRQRKVSKNTNLALSKNIDDFAGRLKQIHSEKLFQINLKSNP